ncbi:MAG: hypothetical protein ABI378_12985 [Chitinophagaceae bacterium]
MQVDIEFQQLIKMVRKLPVGKLRQLKAEIEKAGIKEVRTLDLKTLLLNGPVATKRQIEIIEKNRKAINQWRDS